MKSYMYIIIEFNNNNYTILMSDPNYEVLAIKLNEMFYTIMINNGLNYKYYIKNISNIYNLSEIINKDLLYKYDHLKTSVIEYYSNINENHFYSKVYSIVKV